MGRQAHHTCTYMHMHTHTRTRTQVTRCTRGVTASPRSFPHRAFRPQTEEEMQIKKRDRQGAECEEADRGEWRARGVGRDVHARAQQSAALSADRAPPCENSSSHRYISCKIELSLRPCCHALAMDPLTSIIIRKGLESQASDLMLDNALRQILRFKETRKPQDLTSPRQHFVTPLSCMTGCANTQACTHEHHPTVMFCSQ